MRAHLYRDGPNITKLSFADPVLEQDGSISLTLAVRNARDKINCIIYSDKDSMSLVDVIPGIPFEKDITIIKIPVKLGNVVYAYTYYDPAHIAISNPVKL